MSNTLNKIFSDVDECANGTNNCHENAECSNTQGSFTCECKTGYGGNGTHCEGNSLSLLALQ